MTSFKHTHKYQRIEWGKHGTVVWKCMLPDCSHYVHRHFAVNKKSICHKCGSEFTLTSSKLRRAKPICDVCSSGKSIEEFDVLLNDILKENL